MARPRWPFSLLLLCLLLSVYSSTSSAQQLSASQVRTLFRLQRILEYPPAFRGITNQTDLCYLPNSTALSLACSGNRITGLSVSGNGARLSPDFSMDSLFTTLSRLPSLTELSLTSLGLWGTLPPKFDRLGSLRVLNLSSNHLSGGIPREVSSMAALQSLVLGGNLLNGTVPDLGSLPALEEVDLGGNRLGPEFPLLGGGVVTVVLRNNSFRSRIPPAMQQLGKLQTLDVSSNQLIGPIPPFLFSLPAIRHLDLSGNLLIGALPARLSCGPALGFVDVSRNRLVGSLPACIGSNSSGMVVLDSGNCLSSGDQRYQNPNSYCNEGAFAAALPTAKEGNQTTTTTKKKKSNLGIILGIMGGIAGGALVLGLVLIVALKKSRTEKERAGGLIKANAGKIFSVHASPRLPADARYLTEAVGLGNLGLMPYRVFSMEELEEVTNNFDPSNLMQKDGRHQTYKGWLRDGSTVIVRCLKLKQRYSTQSVVHFVDVTSKLRHRHLVTILGHCIGSDQEDANSSNCVYLVLEHVSNGTLRSHLTEWRHHEMLKWPQRVAAVIGVARGIQFLHTVTVPGISGNDLKIDNILLDESLTAKISNYNIPMVSMNKNDKGASGSPFAATEGTDPIRNDIHRGEDGEKEDVYQLGLILMETITGKPVATNNDLAAMKTQLEKGLTEEPGKPCEWADPNIRGTLAYDSVRTAVEIALNCVSDDPGRRPSVDDVLWNLQYSLQVQEGWANSGSFKGVAQHVYV